jgi:hypothetical protein
MKSCSEKLNASKNIKCLETENKVTKVKININTGQVFDENNNFLGYGTYKNGKITITK